MMKLSSKFFVVAMAVLSLGFNLSAHAQLWVGPAPANGSLGGDWNTAANWNPASVPNGPGAAATFNGNNVTANRAFTYLTAPVTLGSISIDNNTIRTNSIGTLNPTGGVQNALTFNSGVAGVPATFTITGTNAAAANATPNNMQGDVVLTSDLLVTTTLSSSGSAAGELTFRQGQMSGPGGFTKDGTGTVTFADAPGKTYTGPTVIKNGRLRINAAMQITGTSGITVLSGGQFVPDGGTDWTFGPSANTFVTLNGFGLSAFPGAIRTGSGLTTYIRNKIYLASDSSIDVVSTANASNVLITPGTLNLVGEISGPGRLIANQPAGLIYREGTLTVLGANIYTGGTTVQQGYLRVSSAASANANLGTGSVMVDGSYVDPTPNAAFDTYGKLIIESGVTDAIANTAYLNITGGGTANADRGYAELDNGTETVGGLMLGGVIFGTGTYGSSLSGATNIGLANPDEYFSGTGQINVIQTGVPGDYNDNGTVDAADYVLWRKGGPLHNDFTPGVDPGDYNFWRAHFGSSTYSGSGSGAGLGSAAVPEPASVVLIGLLVSMLSVGRRSRLMLD